MDQEQKSRKRKEASSSMDEQPSVLIFGCAPLANSFNLGSLCGLPKTDLVIAITGFFASLGGAGWKQC